MNKEGFIGHWSKDFAAFCFFYLQSRSVRCLQQYFIECRIIAMCIHFVSFLNIY